MMRLLKLASRYPRAMFLKCNIQNMVIGCYEQLHSAGTNERPSNDQRTPGHMLIICHGDSIEWLTHIISGCTSKVAPCPEWQWQPSLVSYQPVPPVKA
jgi:hypothetical protein